MNRLLALVIPMALLATTPIPVPALAISQSGIANTGGAASAPSSRDISGTWVAKTATPMGELEIVYKLAVHDGKITGSQSLPFGDSPIVDGQLTGDTFQFTVELESFGDIQKREVTGKIVGDTLVLTPAFPAPPPGSGPAGGPPPFHMGPVTARRGTPMPSHRAPSVDYAKLPRVALPALQDVSANGLAVTPPMGWNSWNKFHTHIDDATVRGIADAIVLGGLKDAGYQYVIIDDGWQGARDASGVLSPNPSFPDMKALADYVHSQGLKIGIYSSPGPRTCGGFEGSYGHEEQDAKMYASWGMDYLKYDWCSASRIWRDSDMQAAYQKMGEELKKAGRPIVYALCQYGRANVPTWGTRVGANLWRTTGDIRDQYDAMAKIGFAQTALADFAGPGHWNDPDMLEVGNGGMSEDEYKTHFSLWAMIAAPLIAGNDIRNMTPETRKILTNREVIAVDQDSRGVGGKSISNIGEIEIWKKPLVSGDMAIAIFNHSNREMRPVISWTALGLDGTYTVRDLWAHQDRGKTTGVFSEPVPSHGVIMLRLKAATVGQTDGAKVITFNRADTEHCKVITVDNKHLLETTYNGTSVAIGIPTNWGNGEFSVFVSVHQAGAGVAEINPKQIYALYSDTAHTRLEWFNKAREIDPWESARESGPGRGPRQGRGPGSRLPLWHRQCWPAAAGSGTSAGLPSSRLPQAWLTGRRRRVSS